jgi:hypothetical protein
LDKKNRGGMKYLSNKETQKRKPKWFDDWFQIEVIHSIK